MMMNFDFLLANGAVTPSEVADHLVTHYYEGVRYLALSLLNESAEAEDIAQQTMIQAAPYHRIRQRISRPPTKSNDLPYIFLQFRSSNNSSF